MASTRLIANGYARDGRMTKRRSRVDCMIPTTHSGRSSNVKKKWPLNPRFIGRYDLPSLAWEDKFQNFKIPRSRNLFWEKTDQGWCPETFHPAKKVHWLFTILFFHESVESKSGEGDANQLAKRMALLFCRPKRIHCLITLCHILHRLMYCFDFNLNWPVKKLLGGHCFHRGEIRWRMKNLTSSMRVIEIEIISLTLHLV